MSLNAYAKTALLGHRFEELFPERTTFKEFAVRVGHPAREVVREARRHGVNPGYALGRDYPGMEDVLLVAVTEKRSPADVDRLADVLSRVGR
jgi:glycine dehydrogenase subunit 1